MFSITTIKNVILVDYELIPTRRGKNLVMFRGYTYSAIQGIYYCSSRTVLGCTARVKLTKTGSLIVVAAEHSHQPPKYVKTSEGAYVKL